ncbi:DDE-type integrase/transposase/recombinase [Synechococcus sp. CBW1107]|uniref:DDE-type integrase/transposase/recombinase n=1 Tax=Synechococcus sp. CBW1107 TaxID=2789857 RepID=UPI002AD418F1|nr:DDE-type integrase/transposase/recombinase [Synechococcus sp. CBW1107]
MAVWIDLFSRRVVGWTLDQRMDAALVVEALGRALGHRQVGPEQLLLPTDQGSQYRATDYGDLLREHKIFHSMSAKGCCWDNAVVKSYFSTMKLELGLDDNRDTLISPPAAAAGSGLLDEGLPQPRTAVFNDRFPQSDRLRAAVHHCPYTHPCEPLIAVHEIGGTTK